MPTDKPREASPWLIAERARCRLEGLMTAKELFLRLPFPDALQALEVQQMRYEGIIKDPKPTGVPGA